MVIELGGEDKWTRGRQKERRGGGEKERTAGEMGKEKGEERVEKREENKCYQEGEDHINNGPCMQVPQPGKMDLSSN